MKRLIPLLLTVALILALTEVCNALGWTPTGKVAVKLSTGEPPASNYLRPELIKDVVEAVNGNPFVLPDARDMAAAGSERY